VVSSKLSARAEPDGRAAVPVGTDGMVVAVVPVPLPVAVAVVADGTRKPARGGLSLEEG
jgi:hypothetical protein